MRRLKKIIPIFLFTSFFYILGCGPSVVVKQPPPAKTEVRPAKPYANAVWIDGHWKWSGGRYVWVPGHWAKPKPGRTWVAGHWKKTPRGYVWVKGHWR